ncbi:YcgN family cysteine cluster protein [Ectothiorhodospiraceae bacterium BW-2]|nr:YcgN family cysteine cluster protein [Ectothiorhodospiraceae bacterium BW-2]
MANEGVPFWQRPLHELTLLEWELLCDRCGRCCLLQLEDEESGERALTAVACRYYRGDRGGCQIYETRSDQVPECVTIRPENIALLDWMPPSCAYRLRAEGKPLPSWHPLISHRDESVEEAGMSIYHLAISEESIEDIDDLEEYIIAWHND